VASFLQQSTSLVIDAVKRALFAFAEDKNRHVSLAFMGTAKWASIEQGYEQETSAWMVAHHALSRLARERAAADAEEGRWLLAALRSAAHVHLGFGSFSEYVERSFGYKPRSTQEKLRVAEALEELPVLSQALEQGTVHWSTVRELSRVAVPQNEREWLAVAHGKTVRQLEELVAGKVPGDDPSSPSRASERRHVLRFEVAPETFALFREAMTTLRRSADGALDDDAALLALARLALGGPRDEGRTSYQIALTVCAACGRGQQAASGELVAIGPEIVAMAHCDGQHIGCVAPHIANDGGPAGSSHLKCDAHVGQVTPGAANDSAPVGSSAPSNDAHVGRVAPHAVNDGVPVGSSTPSDGTHVGAEGQVDSVGSHAEACIAMRSLDVPVLTRAKQTIPPALRRAVIARDHRRCRVPGCKNSVFLDVHHIQLRSEGGRNDAENLVTLCAAHHRAVHRGQLVIDGGAPAVCFRHGDGSPYGSVLEPQTLEARAKIFSALRNLGFREGEVRAVLAQLQSEGEFAAGTLQEWVRAALGRLTPTRSRV